MDRPMPTDAGDGPRSSLGARRAWQLVWLGCLLLVLLSFVVQGRVGGVLLFASGIAAVLVGGAIFTNIAGMGTDLARQHQELVRRLPLRPKPDPLRRPGLARWVGAGFGVIGLGWSAVGLAIAFGMGSFS
jgi:hypothetical protein